MYIVGLQGSPRKNSNTDILLSSLLDEAKNLGAGISKIEVARKKIEPCRECGTCEKKGFCPIDDEMQQIYPLLRRADLVIMATPIFFYGATAQMKALIDRSQALWSRTYVYKLKDPGRKWRKGFLLAVGATKGKNLFEGVNLTAKYFFDAVGASFDGTIGFKQVEESGAIEKHPTALKEVKEKAKELVSPFLKRKNILFMCRENACRSQMAGAFLRYSAGDKYDVVTAGSEPADEINSTMVSAMEEKGIDMAYIKPRSIDEALENFKPDQIITMGCGDACPFIPGASVEDWDLPDPAGKPIDFMRQVRDEIKKRVESFK
ncbi:NAD(P)H-dependent oxidoreductase [Thermodesulfobacteriota bacterium]